MLARTAFEPEVKNRIASLVRWIQDSGVTRDVTTHALRFVETLDGWGAATNSQSARGLGPSAELGARFA
ncbi:hypothetical protein DAT35_54905 [Vitiosangium sp. GDMCC 1.1324]|nr:hypothetical protein DAT35_54905 [Vitiosangium sp. GDMCC 1.1324]